MPALTRGPIPGHDVPVHSDAHLHLADLAALDPGFASSFPDGDWAGCLASHDRAEWERSEALRLALGRSLRADATDDPDTQPILASFGIHPQRPVMDDADFLTELARSGRIACIGEAGFDFFADRPDRVRNAENLAAQRTCYEFQANLAIECGLPLLIHMRKATDILLGDCRRLSRIRAVVFHCWPGRAGEAGEFLKKGVNAYFSFGTALLRDGPRARESCAAIPAERILSETDAPWQPPHGERWTAPAHIALVESHIAKARGDDVHRTRELLRRNFLAAFGAGGGAS